MAVMAREEWTAPDLNQLSAQVDVGFKEMRTEFKAVRGEIKEELQAVRGEIKEETQAVRGEIGQVRAEMVQLRSDMNAFHRSVIQLVWGIVGTVFLGFMGTIAALFSLV
jgi:IS1 family transposase